jgi:proline dehydrogenase
VGHPHEVQSVLKVCGESPSARCSCDTKFSGFHSYVRHGFSSLPGLGGYCMLRAFFVHLSENRSLRRFAESSSIGRRVSGRFVAGTEIADAVRVTQAVNRAGMSVSIDNLGENVTNPDEARHSAQLYHKILDAIVAHQLTANISLKLTHMGLDVDEGMARDLVSGLVAKAASMNPPGFVRVDMEGSPYTQRTLDFVHELHRMPGNRGIVGTVIQSYLYRSEKDVENLLADGIRIRLCKGAYKEPPEIAFQKKSEVDANYVKLMKILMKSGIYHGLATHDEAIINEAKAFAGREKIARDSFEFQMLHGIRRDLQQQLVREGWGMRVYIPFGTEWYPYFMRRLAERPANVLFIIKNFFRA